MKKRYAIAFTGPSNSGKTTLIEKIAYEMIKSHKIAIIKNDPKDKAHFDIPGKDSDKFSKTGAEVIVTSPTRTTYFSKRESTLDEMIDMLGDFDYLFVEGLKTLPLPRIAIFRNNIEESYFEYSEAIAIADIEMEHYSLPQHIELLNLNETQEIISWIINNAKEI